MRSFCFNFCSLIVAVTTTRRRGIIKNVGGWGSECLGQNSFTRHIFAKYLFYCHIMFFFHSSSRLFLGMIAFDSHSRIVGMDFFIPFCSRFSGMLFSIPLPFLNFGIGIIHSRSRSRTPKSHSRSPPD